MYSIYVWLAISTWWPGLKLCTKWLTVALAAGWDPPWGENIFALHKFLTRFQIAGISILFSAPAALSQQWDTRMTLSRPTSMPLTNHKYSFQMISTRSILLWFSFLFFFLFAYTVERSYNQNLIINQSINLTILVIIIVIIQWHEYLNNNIVIYKHIPKRIKKSLTKTVAHIVPDRSGCVTLTAILMNGFTLVLLTQSVALWHSKMVPVQLSKNHFYIQVMWLTEYAQWWVIFLFAKTTSSHSFHRS